MKAQDFYELEELFKARLKADGKSDIDIWCMTMDLFLAYSSLREKKEKEEFENKTK